MNGLASSYEYHKTIESPLAFVRREWKSFAVFGGGFVAILLGAILLVPPAFYYPRLGTDPLLYYLSGLAFTHTGHTVVRTAINGTPFNVIGMPGVLRSPFMIAFSDFDTQLRAIQLSNVVLVATTAALYAYMVSWVVPKKWHWMAIAFSFAFLLLSPDWVANVFQPLADAPFAFFTLTCVVIATTLFISDKPIRRRPLVVVAFVVCFGIAFLIRFTAIALVAYVLALHTGRRMRRVTPTRRLIAELAVAAIAVVVLIAISWTPIRTHYPFNFRYMFGEIDKADMVLNVLAYALPSQLAPDFALAFPHMPRIDPYLAEFGSSVGDIVVMIAGILISLVTFLGMWQLRKRFAPEIAYTLIVMPVLVFMMNSTARYFISYQPFFWIFFYAGAAELLAPLVARIPTFVRTRVVWIALLVVLGSSFVYLRSRRVAGTLSASRGISLMQTRAYVSEVCSTFTDLRRFLESLPRQRTLLIGARAASGRWTVISRLPYYKPDSSLTQIVATHDVYFLVECGTVEICQNFNSWDVATRQRVNEYGMFSYDSVFSRFSEHAKVRVYRLRNLRK